MIIRACGTDCGMRAIGRELPKVFKESCGLSEAQVAALGSLGFNLGGCFAIIAGLVFNLLSRKNHIAPRLVIGVGVVLLAVGYLGIYACAVGIIPPTFSLLLFFSFLAGLSGTLYAAVYSGSFQPNATAFVLFVGIVPPIIAAVLSIFINLVPEEYHDPVTLPSHLCSHIPSVAGSDAGDGPDSPRMDGPGGHLVVHDDHQHHRALGNFQVEEVPMPRPIIPKATRFLLVYLLVAVMSLYGMISAIWTSEYHLDTNMRQIITLILVVLLSAMLLVPLSVGPCTYPKRRGHRMQEDHTPPVENGAPAPSEAEEPLLQSSTQYSYGAQLVAEDSFTPPKLARDFYRYGTFRNLDSGEDTDDTAPPVEMGLLKAVQTAQFWLLFFCFAVGVGTGLMYMNNLAAYVIALGGHEGDQVVFVALFSAYTSLATGLSRLLLGYVSEYFLHARGTPRTTFFTIVSAIMLVLSFGGMWATSPQDLFSITLIAGVGFGGHWSVIPAIVSDIFGLNSFASNYTFIQFAPALGGFLLATVLTSYEYSDASRAHGGDGTFCAGVDCFYYTWRAVMLLNVLSVISSILLGRLTKDTYKRMHVMEQKESEVKH
eukprot:gene13433-19288_t